MTVIIDPFGTQDVIIGVELELDINISGNNISEVTIKGVPEGFYYDWTGTVCQVRGLSQRLVSDVQFVLEAIDIDGTVTRNGILNVVNAAPIITPPSRKKIIKGFRNVISIPIANGPTDVGVTNMLYIGMRGQISEDGMNIVGDVPANVDFTVDEGTASIIASNDGGEDTASVEFDILEAVFYGFVNVGTDTIYRINLTDGEEVALDFSYEPASLDRTNGYMAADADYLYYVYHSDVNPTLSRIRRIPYNTGNVETFVEEDIADLLVTVSGSGIRNGIAVDDNFIYIVRYGAGFLREIHVYNKHTGAFIRRFNLPTGEILPRGIVIDGDSLIFIDNGSLTISWIDKNTAEGQTAETIKTITYVSSDLGYGVSFQDIAIVNNYIYVVNSTVPAIYRFDPSTVANEETLRIEEDIEEIYLWPGFPVRIIQGITIAFV